MPYTLAAQTRQRQEEAVRRSDRVADAAERAVHQWWRELLALLRSAPQLGLFRLHQAALAHYRRLPIVTRAALREGLTGLYQWGAESARRGVLRAVPRRVLGTIAIRRASRGRLFQRSTTAVGEGRVREATGLLDYRGERHDNPCQHGDTLLAIVPLTEDRTFPAPLDFLFSNPLADFLDDPDSIPDDLLLSLILPTPPMHVIQARVDRLIAPFLATPRPDLVSPGLFASQLVSAYSQGKTLQEIAAELLPIADGVRTSARRVARTWGTDIASRSQFETHESLGPDLVIGYTLFATAGPNSRPWHQARNGQEYFRNPGPGQKGFAQLPHPPREPADPNERPLGSPWLAWNCL